MAKRMVNETIILVREGGKRVTPPIGKPFEFTKEEIKEIGAASSTAISELDSDDDVETAAEADAQITESDGPVKKPVKKPPPKDDGDL